MTIWLVFIDSYSVCLLVCVYICSCLCSCLHTFYVHVYVYAYAYVCVYSHGFVCMHDFNLNLFFDYNSHIRLSVLTLIIIVVNDTKTITTVGSKSFSTRSLTPIIDRKERKLTGQGTKMKIVKDFAKFPSSAIKLERGENITKIGSINGDIENSVTTKDGKFPNNVTTHSLVSDNIEINEVLNKGEKEKEEGDELVQESTNQVSMSTSHLNVPFKNDIINIDNSDSILNSEISVEQTENIINYELLQDEEKYDDRINNQTKYETIICGKNENENDDVNKNENKKNVISTLIDVEDNCISSFSNHGETTTLLTRSVVTSSHQNILKSEIASNCLENDQLFSAADKCDIASTNDTENENKNENKNDNVKEMEEKNDENNSNNNDTNTNIATEKNSESVAISSIKKSVSISTLEPSRAFFNSYSPSNSNLNLNDLYLISNNSNINLNDKRSDMISLDQDEHNNIELNTVIDCPLVEGLGQEDAFKPRRSSIKVSVLPPSCLPALH